MLDLMDIGDILGYLYKYTRIGSSGGQKQWGLDDSRFPSIVGSQATGVEGLQSFTEVRWLGG